MNKRTKLYLDIDGVLLTKHNTQAADGAVELIDFILDNFDCYWLTTHCRDGHADELMKMLSEYFSDVIIQKIAIIKPTIWNTLKTEAIDFSSVFYWLDDYVFEAEKKVLMSKKSLCQLIMVDLNNKNELYGIIQKLKGISNY